MYWIVCLHECIYTKCMQYPQRPVEGTRHPQNWLWAAMGYWVLNEGPPQEQKMGLSTEPEITAHWIPSTSTLQRSTVQESKSSKGKSREVFYPLSYSAKADACTGAPCELGTQNPWLPFENSPSLPPPPPAISVSSCGSNQDDTAS